MDYTVGSLADLISGKDTPNKTKVISEAFVKVKKEPSLLEAPTGPVSIKKEKLKKNRENKAFSAKNPNKKKKNRNTAASNNENEGLLSKPPKLKKAQNVVTGDLLTNDKPNLKRNRENNNTELSENTVADESSSPKQLKLSGNELNAANRIKNKINKEMKNSKDYKDKTVFVGNIPIGLPKDAVKKHFRKYGVIESIRIRGIPVADIKTPKKVAAIKKEFHPDRTSIFAYIRFKRTEDAKNAEAENGVLFHNHHLRVQFCETETKYDESKAIFVGNLPFKVEDEELWNLFKTCGPIAHVRVIRDGRTGIGKGFAYINFKDSDSVQLALEMEKVTLKDRELRLSACENSRAKKLKQGKKRRTYRKNPENEGEQKIKQEGKSNGNVTFTGSKFSDKKKKKKFSKTVAEKKKLAKQLVGPKTHTA